MRFPQDARQEVVAAADLRAEFSRRVNRRVHVPPKPLLCLGPGGGDRDERRIPDDEQVDVAVVAQFPACRGPEDESDGDAVGERCQRIAQHIDGSGRLHEERLQFRKDRRFAIRLEVDLTPLNRPAEHARAGQRRELALHGTVRGACLPHELAQIERLVRVAEQPAQYAETRLAEKHGRQPSLVVYGARCRTHFEFNCTQ